MQGSIFIRTFAPVQRNEGLHQASHSYFNAKRYMIDKKTIQTTVDMSIMFQGCESFIKMSNKFTDTKSLKDISGMFSGCAEVKDPTQNLPTIVCTIENGNDNQKQYCLNLRDNFNYPKSVKYEIKANATSTFIIMLNYKG